MVDARADVDDPPEPEGLEPVRRRRPVLVAAVVVAVVAAFLVVVFAVARNSGDDTADTPLLGRAAPAIAGSTLDGGTFDLGTHRGSWVVVNFFASWCDPCKQEAPELSRFSAAQSALGPDGAELVGVVYNDATDDVVQFLADYGNGFEQVVLDPDGRTAIGYGVVKVPETWVIDPDGIVRKRVISAVSADTLTTLLAEARGEVAP